ncbi:MAG: VOC family protein [Bacteroidota bacterium]
MFSQIDHLVYAVPELESGSRHIQQLLGVPVEGGGRHPDRGTHNHLIGLGPHSYLEIIAKEPNRPENAPPCWMGLDGLQAARMLRWAVKRPNLDHCHRLAEKHQIPLGAIAQGRRQLASGDWLSWQLTEPGTQSQASILPFFIDWGQSLHPSQNMTGPCRIESIALYHPQAPQLQEQLDVFDLPHQVQTAEEARIVIRLQTPNGLVELS